MTRYRITLPNGASDTFEDKDHITHVVVAHAGHRWTVEGAFGRQADAEMEASWLQNGGVRQVRVVEAVPTHPAYADR